MRRLTVWATIATSLVAAPVHASQIIFSNLGPGESYLCCGADLVTALDIPTAFTAIAFPFVPLETFTLDSIEIALSWSSGTNAADFGLTSAGALPGPVLESFHASNFPPFGSTSTSPVIGVSMVHPVLSSGLQYWLFAAAPADSNIVWNHNNIGQFGARASNNVSGGWAIEPSTGQLGAFRVDGTAVPEPSSLLLVGTGIIGLYRRSRSKPRLRN